MKVKLEDLIKARFPLIWVVTYEEARAVEVVFTIDEETGDLTADVKGAQGKTCLDDVLAGLDDLLGDPAKTVKKPEYHRGVRRNVGAKVKAG